MQFVLKIVNLLLYGNFFIAFCAVAMLLQTELLLFKKCEWTYLTTFVFAATLCLYALHRVVGIEKVKDFNEKYRYSVIAQFKHHIFIYGIVSGIVAAYYFFRLSIYNQLLIILPIFLSLGYVLPFFGQQRRLRDFDYIKIFLIAIVWAYMTVLLPIFEQKSELVITDGLVFIERILFIFAITIPFDIRDLKVDEHIQVKTIPAILGARKSKWLAIITLALALLITLILWYFHVYPTAALLGLLVAYCSTVLLILYSSDTLHDYFFTALMDGTMIIQFLLVVIFSYLSGFPLNLGFLALIFDF